MKKTIKIIITLIVVSITTFSVVLASENLFSFYQSQLPSVQERAKIYKEISPEKYTGTYEQNVRLLNYLKGKYPISQNNGDDYLVVLADPLSNREIENPYSTFGADSGQRPSNFKTTLARSLSAIASTTETIYVSSLTTKDSHTLTSSDIGDFISFHINPGSSNDEIIVCTAIGSLSFTGCTRGYGFYTNAAVSGNAKAHGPGETIIISNDDTWLKTQYTANDDNETIYGDWDFASTTGISRIKIGNGATTYNKGVYAYNGDANMPYIAYDEASNTWVYSNDGANSVAIGNGASSYTAGDGLTLTASDFDLDLYTYSGLRILGNGSVSLSTSSDFIILGDNKLYFATSSSLTYSGVPTFSNGFNSSASSTINNLHYNAPSVRGVASSTPVEDGSGNITWAIPNLLLTSSTTGITISNSLATSTVLSTTIPANYLGTNNVIKFRINSLSSARLHIAPYTLNIDVIYGGQEKHFRLIGSAATNFLGYFEGTIMAAGATNAQEVSAYYVRVNNDANTDLLFISSRTDGGTQSMTVDSTSAQTLIVEMSFSETDAEDCITIDNYYVELLTL